MGQHEIIQRLYDCPRRVAIQGVIDVLGRSPAHDQAIVA